MCKLGFNCPERTQLWTVLMMSVLVGTQAGRTRSRLQSGGCEFPAKWTGTWFQKGVPPITIEKDIFSFKGKCLEYDPPMYFIEDSKEKCSRCVAIYEKHPNVLQYRETFCYDQKPFKKACGILSADAPLYSLFRVDAAPIPCPIYRFYKFSYNRGGRGDCRNPISTIDTCSNVSKLLFRFQACADVMGTESTVEELTCLASWKDGSINYLVGKMSIKKNHNLPYTDDNSYRCFVYDYLQEKGEIQMSQNADATCDGLISPWEGSRIMKLVKSEPPTIRCQYPSWLTSHRRWHSLDGKQTFVFSYKEFRINNSHLKHVNTTFVCIEEIHSTPNSTTLVSHGIGDCETGHVCMKFFKRNEHIIEVQMGSYSRSTQEACHAFHEEHEYITLVAATVPTSGCPHLTGTNGLGVQLSRSPSSFTTDICRDASPIVVGCRSQERIQFLTSCASIEDVKSFQCHGHWEENGRSYLVTGLHNSKSKYCFVYWSNDKTTHLAGIHDTCRRTLEPGTAGYFNFNISSAGHCDGLLGTDTFDHSNSWTLSTTTFTVSLMFTILLR